MKRIASVISVLGLATILAVSASIRMLDFAVYRSGAEAILNGTPLYEAHPVDSLLPFTYTPFAAIVFVGLSLPPIAVAQVLLTGLSLCALARTAWLLAGRLKLERNIGLSNKVLAVLILLVALLSEPTQTTLSFGQINLVLLWLVIEDALNPTIARSKYAGALTGIAAALKLTPAIFGLYWLGLGRSRAIATSGVVFAMTVALGWLIQPASSVAYWTDLAFDPARVGGVAYVGNQSLNGFLHRLTPEPPFVLYLAGFIIAVMAASTVTRRRPGQLLALGATSCAMVICSPISWTHHFVWAIPALVALATIRSKIAVALLIVGLALPFIHITRWLGDVPPGGLTASNLLTTNAYLLWAIAALTLFAWVSLAKPRDDGQLKGPYVGVGSQRGNASIRLSGSQ